MTIVMRDPVRLELVKNAVESIADGMALTIVRTSRSSVVRSGMDFSTGLLDHRGRLFGQGLCQPVHLGGMMPALKACIDRYGDDISQGDVFINNDPYEGGSHLPDIFLYKAIFAGDVIVGYACAMAHQTDIGGRVAGGNASDSTEIYQEGLRIPPLKLYSRGQPNEAIFRILEKAVRVPETVLGDVRAQLAALDYGEGELQNLAKRYGVEELKALEEELLLYTEVLTRRALASLPNGSWQFTDYIDDDGIVDEFIPIVVNLVKKDDKCFVNFDGTGKQCRGAINLVFDTTKAMVYSALKHALGSITNNIPNTEGYFRPVSITAPPGSIVNPLPPAPVAARGLTCFRVHQALLGAFAQMLPEHIYACSGGCEFGLTMSGYDKTKIPWKPWVQLEFINESAVGGLPYRDGQDAHVGGVGSGAVIPIETLEVEQPVRIEQFGFVADSEGAGKYRGGLGLVREYRFLRNDTTVQVRADRTRHAPFGLFGGESSSVARLSLQSAGTTKRMPGKFMAQVCAGDCLRVELPGAGGWGEPLERPPDLVLNDVVEEKVTLRRARAKYGVAIDPENSVVNWPVTNRLRATRRKSRSVGGR